MSSASPIASRAKVPALVAVSGPAAATRFLEFFASNINHAHTRRAYAQATREFLAWCERAGVASIADLKPPHVAAYIEQLSREQSAPTVKQRLAAIRGTDELTTTPLPQANAYSMIRRRGWHPV